MDDSSTCSSQIGGGVNLQIKRETMNAKQPINANISHSLWSEIVNIIDTACKVVQNQIQIRWI